MKRILGIILISITLVLAIVIDGGFPRLTMFWNAPSLLFVILIDIAAVVIADYGSDFLRGVSVMKGNNEFTLKEMKVSVAAYELLIKITFVSSILASFIGFINMIPWISDINFSGDRLAAFFTAMGVDFLTIIYGLIINIFFITIRARIIKEVIYRES